MNSKHHATKIAASSGQDAGLQVGSSDTIPPIRGAGAPMAIDGFSWSLLGSAVGVALIHTALGPDHYLPFVMLARAHRWSRPRTALITLLCGLGHVASCLMLAIAGIAAGARWAGLHRLESSRGDLAAWALVAFGVAYAAWGIRRAVRRARGLELHEHEGV